MVCDPGQNPSEEDVRKIQAEIDPDSKQQLLSRLLPSCLPLTGLLVPVADSDKRITFEEFLPVLERVKDKRPPGTQADYIEGRGRRMDRQGLALGSAGVGPWLGWKGKGGCLKEGLQT